MEKTFAYHKPSADGIDKISHIREGFSTLLKLINEVCPKSRETSVAITNLETAQMWSNKAIVVNDPESAVEEMPTDKGKLDIRDGKVYGAKPE